MTDPTVDMAAAIADNVKAVIRHADANAPRSLQQAIGPSEYGHPCQRRIAYKVMGQPEINQSADPWKRNVGTATHAYLERVYGDLQEWIDTPDGVKPRYVLEERVQAPGTPAGHCDLLDRKLHTVYDWKTTGPTALKEYRKGNVGDGYRIQAHTYGAGWAHRGEQVDYVSVVFLPRNGDLKDMHVWVEPLDPAVVEQASARLAGIITTLDALDVEHHPERFALIAAEPNRLCGWCPFHRPLSQDVATGCPGNTAEITADGLLMGATKTSPTTTTAPTSGAGSKEQAA